jgi:UDP-3-O-[3-hydroxymyristoyl] N-acetylglucosamine deacetylase
VIGKITTYKSGHYIHNLLCRKLLDTPEAYKIVVASQLQQNEAVKAFELPMAISSSYH